jgi:Arc/MetJ-type ribon-helix-helix transcriptional regulator
MNDKMRVQLDFTPDALSQLDQLRDESQVSSRADVVRYALRVLQWVLSELRNGSKILVERNGQTQQIVFPFLPSPTKADDAARVVLAESRQVATSR